MDISNATAQVAPDLLKALAILSDTTVRRSSADQEDLKAKLLGSNDSFVLLAYVSLATSRTLLEQLRTCLKFNFNSGDLSCWYKQKSDFYELWQQHKQLKTMEMSEA